MLFRTNSSSNSPRENQLSDRSIKKIEPSQIVKIYEMWKQNPNLKCDPSSLQYSITKSSFNKNFQSNLQHLNDSIIQMAIRMPKSYNKSVQIKKKKTQISESQNKIPDKLSIDLP